jgi:tRNA A22 N-methylase
MANAKRFEVQNNIRFYLSDGAMRIPRDFSHMVCAGMGADTMIHILENAPWLQNEQYTLILQCQSKTPTLRKYLSDNGFCITQETVLKDGRFLYTIMEVRYQQCTPLTAGECWLSPALAASESPFLPAYYKQVITRLQRAINGQKENADPSMVAALTELENNPAFKELSYDNS